MELHAEQLTKVYGQKTILDGLTFSLHRGQRIGLVGQNGTGKSTLLKMLAGQLAADGGTITTRPGLIIGYMPQDTSLASEETVRSYIGRVSGMTELAKRATESPEALEHFEHRDGYTFDHRLEYTLSGLGLDHDIADRPINNLSAGQKSKVFMAGVLLMTPDLLLLDEPTNNLDLPALIWLENFLSRSDAAALIVSHDRQFLDRLIRKLFIIDADTRQLTVSNGRYSDYLSQLSKNRAQQAAAYAAQQDEIERLTASAQAKRQESAQGGSYRGTDNDKFLRNFKRDRAGRSGKTARAIEKRLEQMLRVEKPIEREAFRIRLSNAKPIGGRDIELHGTSIGYTADRPVLSAVTLSLPYGARVAIMGLNGSGKSTLLKTISQELPPLAGTCTIGSGLVIGNLMQEHDNLPRDMTLKLYLTDRVGVSTQTAFMLIAQHGFSAEEIDKTITTLSPGGRARLLFAAFTAQGVNVLLLDEPTNHLDLEALQALEEAVAAYTGTIVVVSHDRAFLDTFKPTDTYAIIAGELVRQPSLTAYIEESKRIAKRLIGML